jgi:hypothetical protein
MVTEPENLKTVPVPTFFLNTVPVPTLAPVPATVSVPGLALVLVLGQRKLSQINICK